MIEARWKGRRQKRMKNVSHCFQQEVIHTNNQGHSNKKKKKKGKGKFHGDYGTNWILG